MLEDDEGDYNDGFEHNRFNSGFDDGVEDLDDDFGGWGPAATARRNGAPDDGGVSSSDELWLQLLLCGCDSGNVSSVSVEQRRRRNRSRTATMCLSTSSPTRRDVGPWSAANAADAAADDSAADDGASLSVFAAAVVLPHDGGGRGGGLTPGDADVTCEEPFRCEGSADRGDDGGAAGGGRSDDALRAAWRDNEAHDKLDKVEAQVSRRCCPCFFWSRAFVRSGLVWRQHKNVFFADA